MKYFIFSILLISLISSCDLREKELRLQAKENQLKQKEDALAFKEDSLRVWEEELNSQKLISDSILADSLSVLHPGLPGTWTVNMLCTEATCSGSAVGDSKTEQWEIFFQNNKVIANVKNENVIVRTYSGTYTGNRLKLSSQAIDTTAAKAVQMLIELRETKPNEMEGEREIIRPEDCHIVYSLKLKKKITNY